MIVKLSLLLILSCWFVSALEINSVIASGTIYIRADGSVEPSTAPILRVDDFTYALNDSIMCYVGGVVVERDNIVIDGEGFKLQGNGTGTGIDLSRRRGILIEDIEIDDFYYGILLNESSSITVFNSTISEWNTYALQLSASLNTTISGNTINKFIWRGIELLASANNSIIENEIGRSDAISRSHGIWLENSSDNIIAGNNVTNNDYAMRLVWSFNNTISGNLMASHYLDFRLEYSHDNAIFRNNVTSLRHSQDGIHVIDSDNNTFTENNIAGNYAGMYVYRSRNNSIFRNNFLNNIISQVTTLYSTNVWDEDYPSGGNYWSDFESPDSFRGTNQNETGSDGICDKSRIIDQNNSDNYPLKAMFSSFTVAPEQHVQTICNSTISGFYFNGSAIHLNVEGKDGTVGFCRICIPTCLINYTYSVLVNGTAISYDLLPCSNETHGYLYFTYGHSTQEIVVVTESSSVMILHLFAVETLLLIWVCRKREQS